MTLWFVFALMTAGASFAVLWPLRHRDHPRSGGSEAAVYRDQPAEIDRDVASGLIGSAEADAARVEISRRLLATVDARREPSATSSNLKWRRSVAVVALVGLPILALAIYLPLGSPQLGDFPFAERAHTPSRRRSTVWWRRSKRIWQKIRPMAAAGAYWRGCWQGSAATMKR